MTDAPAPRQPSGETLPPAEDETRFAPKANIRMKTPPPQPKNV